MVKNFLSRIRYNSPVILTYTIICLIVLAIDYFTDGKSTLTLFCAKRDGWDSIYSYSGLILYIFGHDNFEHFFSNFTIILLVGPMLEEKYGSVKMFIMIIATAIITGIVHIAFSDAVILGASGIAFMFILLSSFTNYKKGEIPATFIAIIFLYAGSELVDLITKTDNIAQGVHLVGGICGCLFGFLLEGRKKEKIENDLPQDGVFIKNSDIIDEEPKYIDNIEEEKNEA